MAHNVAISVYQHQKHCYSNWFNDGARRQFLEVFGRSIKILRCYFI